jgi:hypothetical protein
MSRDNGIYVLITKGAEEGQLEYRVAPATAIDRLWERGSTPEAELAYKGDSSGFPVNLRQMRSIFGHSPVFTDRCEALLTAADLYTYWGGISNVEYGICLIDCSHVLFSSVQPAPAT